VRRTGLLLRDRHTNNKMQYIIGNGEKKTVSKNMTLHDTV